MLLQTKARAQILENEHQTWSEVVTYVQEHNVDCDLWIGDTFDVPITEDAADTARAALDAFQEAGGKANHVKVIDDPIKAAEVFYHPSSRVNMTKIDIIDESHQRRKSLLCVAGVDVKPLEACGAHHAW